MAKKTMNSVNFFFQQSATENESKQSIGNAAFFYGGTLSNATSFKLKVGLRRKLDWAPGTGRRNR
jgi:hypothetical protein